MIASPINPSDLLTIEGRYGRLPHLPATPGYEGVGVVEASGGGLLGWWRKGKRVAVINERGGNWQEYVVVSAKHVVPVPPEIPDEQAATFFVNPATALVMTRDVLKIRPGAWLLQTAAGSALGQMVIRLSQMQGFHTINVVRRREQAEQLKKLGASEVICESEESIVERVQAITKGLGVPYVIDAVGGSTGTMAVKCLAAGGHALLYGLLSGQAIEVDPRLLITGSKKVEGFWLADWVRKQGVLRMLKLFRQVKHLMKQGVLHSDIAAVYPIEEYQKAMQHVQASARGGKILLKITAPP